MGINMGNVGQWTVLLPLELMPPVSHSHRILRGKQVHHGSDLYHSGQARMWIQAWYHLCHKKLPPSLSDGNMRRVGSDCVTRQERVRRVSDIENIRRKAVNHLLTRLANWIALYQQDQINRRSYYPVVKAGNRIAVDSGRHWHLLPSIQDGTHEHTTRWDLVTNMCRTWSRQRFRFTFQCSTNE